ncbi:hypothetical protein ACKWRH_45905 (plasmid) [Bradyrhizobium sp. Pa8]|uniref:hypothetical protein n=1 Tax=Bradyrhizobium sp. Pa8 TaxID=3386552 RepID=UPI00403F1F60
MVATIEHRRGIGGSDLLDATAHRQLPLMPIPATVHGRNVLNGEITITLPVDWSLLNTPRRKESVTQERLSNIQAKLTDFAAGVDMSTVAALIVRLNSEFRKAARQDGWAALKANVAAQEAAATALRNSGLCQLFGAIVTSGGAMGGAAVNLRGARQIQTRFDELYKAKIQAPLPKSTLETPVPNKPPTQAQYFDQPEGEPQLFDTRKGKAQLSQEQGEPSNIETSPSAGRGSSDNGNAPNAPRELDTPPDSTTGPLEFTRVAQAQTAAQQEAMRWNGMVTIATEAAKLPGAGLNMGATHYLEEKAKLEAAGIRAQAQVEDERAFMAGYEMVIQNFLGTLAEIRHADSETRSRIVNMA